MELFELYSHSFVVKIWLEETAEETDGAFWRGQITHVGSNERKYFQELGDLVQIIWPYLEAMDVKDEQAEKLLNLIQDAGAARFEVSGNKPLSQEEW